MSFMTTFFVICMIVLAFQKEKSPGRTASRILLWICAVVFFLLLAVFCSAIM